MALEFKDYYTTLGVARTASDDEIRKAFRKLARQFHPDVAKNKATAEEKFKEINEAYEVLGDPEKRKKYDELGANWKSGGEFRPPPRARARGRGRPGQTPEDTGDFEFQFGGTGFSDFFEQFFGATGGRNGGFAGADGRHETVERGQDIEADILVSLEEAAHGATRPISLRRSVPCESCHGTGVQGRQPCPACGGQGHVAKEDRYQVKIPTGVGEGQRLRLAGRGEAGHGGGPAGDLFLRVRLAKHPDFRVEGSDLYYDLDLAPWEAVLGAQVSVPTLAGRVNIKVPPGTQNGQRLRVRSKGLPTASDGQGDLYAVIHLQVPPQVTDAEKALWENLARESAFKPRG